MSVDPNARPGEVPATNAPATPPRLPNRRPTKHAWSWQPTGPKSILREYAEAIIIAMLLAFAIRVFVVQAFKIPSVR